jgi:SAM-dependent methyltransferase
MLDFRSSAAVGYGRSVSDPENRANEPCCFDDWVEHWDRKARDGKTVAGVTGPLVDALERAGLADRTVLDVGCGIGDLAIETLARGAVSATGFDLSAKAIDHARELAATRGVADRTTFEVGDGSIVDLPPADVVVLNRVVCCYRNADDLLDRTLGAAGSVFAMTAPVSGGATGLFNRALNAFWNLWYSLRQKKFGDFRTFVHDLDEIDERVRRAGFRRVAHDRRRVVWELGVYAR